MPQNTTIKERWRGHATTFGLWLAFWLVVCMADSTWYYFMQLSKGAPTPWTRVIEYNLPYWLYVTLLTPAVIWVSRRAGFGRGHYWRAVLVHLVGLVSFTILHATAYRVTRNLMESKPLIPAKLVFQVRQYVAPILDRELLLYAVIVIAVSAIDYYVRFRERERVAAALELEQARLKASLSEAQLDALKMQLQPHFLFNALHAISTLIMRGDPRAANQMLMHLSRFLRMTLENTTSQEVPMEVELEFLDAYLRIQRERFGDRLQVAMDVGEDALVAAFPSLALQPLVENAIRHGIDSEVRRGTITIRAQVEGPTLKVQVQDDGPGLRGNTTPTEGVGMRNIRARLAQLYPNEHSFTLGDVPSGGAVATIVIPFRVA